MRVWSYKWFPRKTNHAPGLDVRLAYVPHGILFGVRFGDWIRALAMNANRSQRSPVVRDSTGN